MSLFRGSGRLEQKLAQNNDPMKQKKLWVKSFYCAAVLAALGGLDIAHYIARAEAVNPEMPMIIEHLKTDEEYRRAIERVLALPHR